MGDWWMGWDGMAVAFNWKNFSNSCGNSVWKKEVKMGCMPNLMVSFFLFLFLFQSFYLIKALNNGLFESPKFSHFSLKFSIKF
jgi:hypothetical protein